MAELRFDVYDGETATIREYVLRLRSTESIHFMALNVFDGTLVIRFTILVRFSRLNFIY